MEQKREQEQKERQEDGEREYKQKRLGQRVKCSPALVSNSLTLAKKRQEALARGKRRMQQ